MKKILLSLLLFGIASSVIAQTNPAITNWLINTTGETGSHYIAGNSTPIEDTFLVNVKTVQYSNDFVYVNSSGIPSYVVGPYQDGNPSLASDRDHLFQIPLNPVPNTGTPTQTPLGTIAVLINGVPLYDYKDAQSYSLANGADDAMGDGVWNRNAILAEREGFDCAKGHPSPVMTDNGGGPGSPPPCDQVPPGMPCCGDGICGGPETADNCPEDCGGGGTDVTEGQYHHHQNPTAFNLDLVEISDVCDLYLADALYVIDPNTHSPLLGFSFDGYPIYGAYGYTNTDGTGGIKRIESSYQERNITVRTNYTDGTNVTNGPPVNATYPIGWYKEDYEFIANSGDLDEFNGRFAVTPEYPNGTYAYYTTVDQNWNSTYPYAIAQYYGVVSGGVVDNINEAVVTFGEDCVDSDLDTVCDVDDICDGGDDLLDTNANNMPDECEPVAVSIRAFLEAPFASTEMNTNLASLGLIPMEQPYNAAPYYYTGNESINSIPGDMVDWVLIDVRTSINASDIVTSKAGLLMKDGYIKGLNGTDDLYFDLPSGDDYYFVLRHRNHLDIMTSTATPHALTMAYDFTTAESQAYGTQQLKQLDNGSYAMFGGDITVDHIIQVTDYDVWALNPALLSVYTAADINLDGTVQVTDYDAWFANKAKLGAAEVACFEFTWCQDADGDGLGNPAVSISACAQPIGYVSDCSDPDDTVSNTLSPWDEFNPLAVTISFDGDDVTIESNALPNHTSPYWATTNPLYIDPVIANEAQMSPGAISAGSYILTVPISPELAANSSATGLGAIGISVTGAPIFNDEEGPNISLSENVASGFDYAGGHMGPTGYHYHLEAADVSENTVLSHDDNALVGILQDGFFLYGRRDTDGSYPTDLDESGGHFGVTPHSNGESIYHYHVINEFYVGSYILLFGVELQGTPNTIM